MNRQAMTPTTRKRMDSTIRVRDRDMDPRRALITGENTTVDNPKAEAPRPEAKPRLWGNHFCMQDSTEP